MKRIRVGKNMWATVDDEDYDFLVKFKWYAHSNGYVFTPPRKKHGVSKSRLMHRMVMNAPDGIWVDHINRRRMDNRRSNLRFCTPTQNHINRTDACGVRWDKRAAKWRARIIVSGHDKHIGFFTRRSDAVKARTKVERETFGEFSPRIH